MSLPAMVKKVIGGTDVFNPFTAKVANKRLLQIAKVAF
jgi:hypothetical protein